MEKILLVEGSKSFAALLGHRIESELHFKVFWASTLAATKAIIQQEGTEFFLGILGLYLADAPKGEIVDYILSLKIPSIVFTGEMKEEVPAQVVSKQILDYFIKDNVSSIDSALYFIDRLRKNAHIKALVVDDSKSSRYQIKQFLLRCNFTVIEAPDGPQALLSLQTHPDVQLIIVDYEMPGMNGFQLIKRIRAQFVRDRTAIIGLSSHGTGDIATQFLKAGANDFLAKPFRDEELFCRVSQNIEIIEKNLHMENLVTERTQRLSDAHEQLKNREKRLASILDTALDAIITSDHLGLVTGFNPAAESLFGYTTKEAIGKSVADLIIPDNFKQQHIDALHRIAQSNQTETNILRRRIEAPAKRADGAIIDMEMALTSDTLNGTPTFTAFLHDITDRKQLLKSLEETLQVAESSNRTKSEFLANMSHEIRTPMNAIIGMTDLVLGTELTELQRDNLLIVQNASQNLLDLINTILDLSKIEAGKFRLENIAFDVHGRIGNACETLAIRAHQKGIGFYCQIASNLPKTLQGDPLRLTQVLINLINNAIKFTEKGEVTLNVERAFCKSTPQEQATDQTIMLRFSITDTGIGIPPDRLVQIFDRFTQVDGSTTRKYGGTGLGLTISRSIIHLMDGDIEVTSQENQGSVFSFTACFKLGSRKSAGPNVIMEGREEEPSPTPLANMRVVAAYANATGRTILHQHLSHAGATVKTVTDLSALQTLLQQADANDTPFDLLIIDHQLLNTNPPFCATLTQQTGWKNRPIITAPPAQQMNKNSITEQITHAVLLAEPILRFPLLRAINRALGISAPTQPSPPRLRRAHRARNFPLKILVVDDLVNNQKLAVNILEQSGHVVEVANNGLEAWTILQNKSFDLIIMDLQMPGMDGHKTTEKIRQSDGTRFNANIPIIACTAHALETDRQRCLQTGMNGFLRKPYRAEELLDSLTPFMRIRPVVPAQKVELHGIEAVFKAIDGDPEEIKQARLQFLQELPQQLNSLKQAITTEDHHQAQAELQWFKNGAEKIGAYRVKWQTMRLRSQIELKNQPQALTLLMNLEEDCQKIKTVMQIDQPKSTNDSSII